MEKFPFNREGGLAKRDSVDVVIKDMSDRAGLKHVWGQIEDDMQEEIKNTWRTIIQQEPDPEKAVDLILKDLTDRRGLRQEWDQIDEVTQTDIRQVWVELIRQTDKKP